MNGFKYCIVQNNTSSVKFDWLADAFPVDFTGSVNTSPRSSEIQLAVNERPSGTVLSSQAPAV